MEKLLRDAHRMIRDSGLAIEVKEAEGRQVHHEFFFGGRRVFILSKGSSRGHDLHKLRSAINRASETP